MFSRHPMLLQTAFSELKRQASEQPFLLVGTPGSVGTRAKSSPASTRAATSEPVR